MANTKRNKVLIKGSIPTIHAVVSEVSEELMDRKKRQVSSDFQSSFDKVKRNRSEFIIFWLWLRRDVLTEYELEAKKRKVEEARASSSNSLDFHDVVDDRVEKNPCSDSSDIHESSINTISTASNVTIAAPLLVCTTHLTSPVASTSANISCITLISETPLSAVTSSLSLTPLQGNFCVDCMH